MKSAIHFLSKPTLLFYALPWLMFLLVLGTVAQRYIGLYQSQKLFFGSFILWAGIIPLPGAYMTIGIIALGLITKLFFKSPFKKNKIGIIITHASTLILLAGGIITASFNQEGYIVLGPNETSHTISDYHQRELAILKNDAVLLTIAHQELASGKEITLPTLPFSITIETFCYNCVAHTQESKSATLRDVAHTIDISPADLEKEDAQNQSGVKFSIKNAGNAIDGTYISYEPLAKQPEIKLGNDNYKIVIRASERSLPFSLHLMNFEKSEYPGTNIARSYRSTVEVKDGDLKWNAVIEMNQPLRYRGYTLYQSSFIENDSKLMTVLAVVKNVGDIFPYLAITTLCLGLAIHIVITFRRKRI